MKDKANGNLVYMLRKFLYGINQSRPAWFDRFTKTQNKSGYYQGQVNHTLFVKFSNDKTAILIVYVDDIIIARNDLEEILNIKRMPIN